MYELHHILLVEDDSITTYLHERLIKKVYPELKLVVRANGREALHYMQSCLDQKKPLPGIVLLDLNMPVMDGYEFLRMFRRLSLPLFHRTRVVVLSSSDMISDQEQARQLGASCYLSKPLNKDKMQDIMENNFAA